MRTEFGNHDRYPSFDKVVLALKAARLQKGISRPQAASLLGWTRNSFEQIENGRCNISPARIEKIYTAYGFSKKEFEKILESPKFLLAKLSEQGKTDQTVNRKPRRNHFKIVTKEVRVIRTLRRRLGISQHKASRLCGMVPGGFGHIEVGRINLDDKRINHILKSLGYSRPDFDRLMAAPKLRDEILEDCSKCLLNMPEDKLESAFTILSALAK